MSESLTHLRQGKKNLKSCRYNEKVVKTDLITYFLIHYYFKLLETEHYVFTEFRITKKKRQRKIIIKSFLRIYNTSSYPK